MLKIIAGVFVGFIVWSVLWVAGDAVLRTVWTNYDESVKTMSFSAAMLVVPLILSAVVSIISGFVAALTAGENTKSPLILGVILLLVGILVQMSVWDKIPLWYHLTFWILLVPMTILGGKLKTQTRI
ncbi:MAG: hypothetical protein LH472_13645 [Pyrinomonadaceae bacterium]|nr:hypothetical protein [Pyrinomonadaceae bacterium]